MILYRKLWNCDLLWEKLWYYGKTIVYFSIFVRENPQQVTIALLRRMF